jgi:hypothetical protein
MESDSHKDSRLPSPENRAAPPARGAGAPEPGPGFSLQPLAPSCFATGRRFEEGDRVVSFLVRLPSFELRRFDLIAASADGFAPEGALACRWVHIFRPRTREGDAERALKLTAENLFLTLADPMTEQTPETARMVQFLALMLERKRILRARGLNADGTRTILEHLRTRQRYEIPAEELTPEFFVAIQAQLAVLVGEPKAEPASPQPAGSGGRGGS